MSYMAAKFKPSGLESSQLPKALATKSAERERDTIVIKDIIDMRENQELSKKEPGAHFSPSPS